MSKSKYCPDCNKHTQHIVTHEYGYTIERCEECLSEIPARDGGKHGKQAERRKTKRKGK